MPRRLWVLADASTNSTRIARRQSHHSIHASISSLSCQPVRASLCSSLYAPAMCTCCFSCSVPESSCCSHSCTHSIAAPQPFRSCVMHRIVPFPRRPVTARNQAPLVLVWSSGTEFAAGATLQLSSVSMVSQLLKSANRFIAVTRSARRAALPSPSRRSSPPPSGLSHGLLVQSLPAGATLQLSTVSMVIICSQFYSFGSLLSLVLVLLAAPPCPPRPAAPPPLQVYSPPAARLPHGLLVQSLPAGATLQLSIHGHHLLSLIYSVPSHATPIHRQPCSH
jgi:hypothetical protein